MPHGEYVVIFDGECILCNRCVDILLRLDIRKRLRYTTSQGKFAKTHPIKIQIDSITFLENGIFHYKSTAILKILRSLGGIWIIANIFYIIPRFMRDFIYDIIAKHRYNIFGKMASCRIPNNDELNVFLP